MLLVINFIDFFSKSEWIDLLSGILLWFTFSSQKKQFKSQKDQFKEQNEQSKNQLKDQNELAIKKEKRMLVTKLRLDKHELFLSTLTDYIFLVGRYHLNIHIYLDGNRPIEKTKEIAKDFDEKLAQKEVELSLLSIYYPYTHVYLDEIFRHRMSLFSYTLKDFILPDVNLYDDDSSQFKRLTLERDTIRNKGEELKTLLTANINKILTDLESTL